MSKLDPWTWVPTFELPVFLEPITYEGPVRLEWPSPLATDMTDDSPKALFDYSGYCDICSAPCFPRRRFCSKRHADRFCAIKYHNPFLQRRNRHGR